MASKEQIAVPVADLRARIDGQIRFGHAINGYNQTDVNTYIDELISLHNKELDEALTGKNKLENRCQHLAAQNENLKRLEEEWNNKNSKLESKLEIITAKAQSQQEELTELKEKNKAPNKEHSSATTKDLAEISEEINAQIAKHQAALAKSQKELVDLEIAYDQSCKKNIAISSELEKQKSQYQKINKQVKNLQSENKSLLSKLKDSEQQLEKIKQDWSAKLAEITLWEKKSLSELQGKLSSCQDYLDKISDKSNYQWDEINPK